MSMSSNAPPSPARSAPLSPPQSALALVEVMVEVMEDTVEDTVGDQDLGAMALLVGGRGGLLTLLVDQDMPGVEDAAEEDHQGMEDHQGTEDQDLEDTEDLDLVMEDLEVLSDR